MASADNDGEGEFFYDEDEVIAGASGDEHAEMLDHLDSLLQMPRAADLDEVCCCAQHTTSSSSLQLSLLSCPNKTYIA